MKFCIKCQIELNSDNWSKSCQNKKYFICKKCKNNKEKNRIGQIRLDTDKLNIIYNENNQCTICNIVLTIENWDKNSASKRYYCCKQCLNNIKNKKDQNLKIEIIKAYGGKCTCCNEENAIFLTIDHIFGDGAEERKQLNNISGAKFYRLLKRQNYPKDRYQILCFNCNFAKHVLGACPHQYNI